jgi:hypothetical protein
MKQCPIHNLSFEHNFSDINSFLGTFVLDSNSFFIVGNDSTPEDIIAATNIALGIQFEQSKQCEKKPCSYKFKDVRIGNIKIKVLTRIYKALADQRIIR